MKFLVAAALFMSAFVAHAQSTKIAVFSSAACGDWVAARADSARSVPPTTWLAGALSGYAIATGKNFVPTTTLASAALWMDNYCKNNPLSNPATGVDVLARELITRAGQ